MNELFSPTGQGFNSREMKKHLKNATIAVVGDDEIDDSVSENCEKLSLIIKWGVGIDNIKISKDTTGVKFKKNKFIYEFLTSMRQKANDPLGQRAKKRKKIKQR